MNRTIESAPLFSGVTELYHSEQPIFLRVHKMRLLFLKYNNFAAWEKGLQIDMLFMDIQIPHELDGLKTAKIIFEKNEYIPIAFITNYAEYACEGYLVNALRYILKPIRQQDIDDCMNIAWKRWGLAQAESIRIETGKQIEVIPVQHILLIESFSHQLVFTLASGKSVEARGTIIQYIGMLSPDLFGQCHKSYLVNIMYVPKINNNSILLSNGRTVPIGRKYAASFYRLFNQYYQGR